MCDVKIKIELKPLIVKTIPNVKIMIDGHTHFDLFLSKPSTHRINASLERGKHKLRIIFTNKNYREISRDKDMAIKVAHVGFQNLEDNFHSSSFYRPIYPMDIDTDAKQSEIIHSDYLGWNGEYFINFETPIYHWIHEKLNLGWLIK